MKQLPLEFESRMKSLLGDGYDDFVSSLNAPPVKAFRVNKSKISLEEFEKINPFGEEKIPYVEGGYYLDYEKVGNHPFHHAGLIYVQEPAAMAPAECINIKPNSKVLDMCAAPGGKSFSMALLMENKGEVISCDIYDHKCELIKKSANRLGLDIIKPTVQDGTVYNANLGEFDCVLCDVPCSGLGIIRRKPDIKYKDFSEFDGLLPIQKAILNNAKKYVKAGGKMLYSTCTLRKAENEDIINEFLAQNSDFKLEYSHTFMPHIDGTDGFYSALLIKN